MKPAIRVCIADDYRHAIRRGKITGKLPSESTIGRAYGVRRETAHYALKILKDEGLIEPVKGVGWFVAGTGDHRPVQDRLRDHILDNYWQGDMLPGEHGLCEELKVSRSAIRNALVILHAEGIISAPPGRRHVLVLTRRNGTRPLQPERDMEFKAVTFIEQRARGVAVPRGTCQVCLIERRINIDGLMYQHGARRNPCSGSHKPAIGLDKE